MANAFGNTELGCGNPPKPKDGCKPHFILQNSTKNLVGLLVQIPLARGSMCLGGEMRAAWEHIFSFDRIILAHVAYFSPSQIKSYASCLTLDVTYLGRVVPFIIYPAAKIQFTTCILPPWDRHLPFHLAKVFSIGWIRPCGLSF